MPYFATAFARTPHGWLGRELDLDEDDDLDGVADALREYAAEDSADVTLLFVEEDDEWLGVARVDGDADPRVFISDFRAVQYSDMAARLAEDLAVERPAATLGEEESVKPSLQPAGDVDLLTDFGTAGDRLLELCAEEGLLPADVITELCERAGCVEQLEQLREG
ncbi:MAG: tRNA adenosine deaminase-associated protein [Mycobacteriales bacterium]